MLLKKHVLFSSLFIATALASLPAMAARVVTPGNLPEIPNFEAAGRSSTAMDLKLSDSNVGLTGYYVEMKAAVAGGYQAIQWLPASATSHTVQGLQAGLQHCFYLRSYVGNGSTKKYSARVESCATTAPAPPTPTVWVDDDGVQAAALGITTYYNKIGLATAKSPAGSVIGVLPGTYNEFISIIRPMTVQAMQDRDNLVNPFTTTTNQDWPVVVNPPYSTGINGAVIRNLTATNGVIVPVRDVSLHGFLIQNAGFNGIQVAGSMTVPKITSLCENIMIKGNKIVDSQQDGIKVSQCNNVTLLNNVIDKYDRRLAKEIEHAIDFVAVGNSLVKGNLIMDGGIGMTVKGGSMNVLVTENNFAGPFRWIAMTAGEPSATNYSFYSSFSGATRYQAKHVMISNNKFGTLANSNSMAMIACQDCSVSNNEMVKNRIQVISRTDSGVIANVCIDAKHALEVQNTASSQIFRSECASFGQNWPQAQVIDRGGTIGFDMY